ncbi:aspartic peptidase domain-containing protein [Suillus spraguei]|nr:aspartic peptidase domain-containing protein [Suillus spraguei]
MFFTTFLLTLLLALSITGSPVEVRNSTITLALTRKLNLSNDTIDLVQEDKARVAAIKDYHTHGRRAESISMLFTRSCKYTAALSVGIPPRTYNLLVDTGSATTWIGAKTPYGQTGVDTGQRVGVTYGVTGGRILSFSGTIFRDTVTLGGGLTIPNYDLAVASTWSNIRYDGILGLGPQDLTVKTLTDSPDDRYPTFTDCLVKAGVIDHHIVGIFFRPTTGNPDTDVGELSFGDIDYTKITSNIVYIPITEITPSANFWGIDQSITYGDTDILDEVAGIIDSGSSFIKIAPYAYRRYRIATGATFDEPTGLLRITLDRYNDLQPLNFHMSQQTLTLVPNAQIWPRSLNQKLRGGEIDGIYLIMKNLGRATHRGFGFIAGYLFMQRFYTVLNDDLGVGFATTPFTDAITN